MKKPPYMSLQYLSAFIGILLLWGCSDDEPTVDRPEPTITFQNNLEADTRLWGEEAGILATVDAQAGLKTLVVTKDGVEIETIQYPEGKAGDEYEINESIPLDATIGTEIVYGFTATDRLNREVPNTFTITVGTPPAPQLSFPGSDNALLQAGDSIDISLLLDAQAGISDVFITKDGVPFDTVAFDNGTFEVGIDYRAGISASLFVGDMVTYGFQLEDILDRKTESIDFTIEVGTPAPTFTIIDTLIVSQNYKWIKGDINIDTTLLSNESYALTGIVKVTNRATLTIEAGTTIYADTTGVSTLAVQQNSSIMAEGTSDAPIIFTSLNDNPEPGDWGGIHLNGLGTVTAPNALLAAEVGDYGGSNNADNSGTMKYIRIEYAGRSVGGSTGALNFNGVGNATVVDFVHIFNPNSHGIRFRGGKSGLKHALVTDPETRAIRWDNAWTGYGQFWTVTYSQEPPSNDTAIEGRDVGSNPTISNVTVLSLGGIALDNTRGIRLRSNTHGKIYNAIITNTERGVRADTGAEPDITNGDLVFANSRVFNNPEGNYRNDGAEFENGFDNSSTPVTLTGYVGSDATGALDPTTLSPWFSSASYIGAVETGNDWTTGWIKE
ncbi:hypothetical protein FNH22_14395 [Fulvivirga sp. M361]|uniref:hypothetical protein n=1 Tax=Fulvivirga sp. M361 TaxID=2594266 RepID=UPI00117A89DE|nr:hypothetical protein [Fulvivirga sp. M361]TRX58245.1 hypothetical protein FNH22_14395 [Fulvivirga sp. M361]